jgi:formate dehydrogenase subunit beta
VASEQEKALRERARELLSGGGAELVIGYGKTYLGEGVRPLFSKTAADAERLVWNARCVHNLATYLSKEPASSIIAKGGRVGIVSKGCDARSIVALVQEKQLGRDAVHVIGLVCNGVVAGEASSDAALKCRGCEVQVPSVYDDLVGDESDAKPIKGGPGEDIERIRSLERGERWDFWTRELARCIKCYACRQACPLCYCGECVTEKSRPQWIEKASSLRGNIAYHFIRAMHLAGRCVACGECARACPMNIPVDLLSRFLSQRVEEVFDYKVGVDPEVEPFYVTNREDDPEDFIR